jgi:hypothetical protein
MESALHRAIESVLGDARALAVAQDGSYGWLVRAKQTAPQAGPSAATARRSYSLTRLSGVRPCEMCYRPLTQEELRFCTSCARKAKRLHRI